MAAEGAVGESEHIKALIISTTQALREDKDALGTFLGVVRRSERFAELADTMQQSTARPAKPSFYGVHSTEFDS
ncbi:hypothetical protein [Streptomyces sp. NBC_01477]|uniref:hypothetical protein n=1 Tax=Streptomyces sp. NBC_01477 TaxID=2976015 RepID=UPI002E357156|nr:hypothetical protein [Streptomyces sp. NBC_01477]